jgi:hypothetical protein
MVEGRGDRHDVADDEGKHAEAGEAEGHTPAP